MSILSDGVEWAMTVVHIHWSCATCSFTHNKFISFITHSLHFFLDLPSGHCPPNSYLPHLTQHMPSALFTCPIHLNLLWLNLTERSSTPHLSATSLLDLLFCYLTPAMYLSILQSHLHRTSISICLSKPMFLLLSPILWFTNKLAISCHLCMHLICYTHWHCSLSAPAWQWSRSGLFLNKTRILYMSYGMWSTARDTCLVKCISITANNIAESWWSFNWHFESESRVKLMV